MFQLTWAIGVMLVGMGAFIAEQKLTNDRQTEQIQQLAIDIKERNESMNAISDRLSRIEERQISQTEATKEIKEILSRYRE